MVEISDTIGLWERSLIAWPDGHRDTTTFAGWLQGPALFADLRQPAGPPSFEGVSCRDHLETRHFAWLARQEGFAGRLVRNGRAFEWQRHIDFQCPTSASDAGYLAFENGVLIEEGRDVPYIEHWHRASSEIAPHFALRLRDGTGREAYLVRAGSLFMYVRGRAEPLPFAASLPELVKSASSEEARTALDCEMSLGRVRNEDWMIERSSLPYRVNANLAPSFSVGMNQVATSDVANDGTGFVRNWIVLEHDTATQKENATGYGNDQGFPHHSP